MNWDFSTATDCNAINDATEVVNDATHCRRDIKGIHKALYTIIKRWKHSRYILYKFIIFIVWNLYKSILQFLNTYFENNWIFARKTKHAYIKYVNMYVFSIIYCKSSLLYPPYLSFINNRLIRRYNTSYSSFLSYSLIKLVL